MTTLLIIGDSDDDGIDILTGLNSTCSPASVMNWMLLAWQELVESLVQREGVKPLLCSLQIIFKDVSLHLSLDMWSWKASSLGGSLTFNLNTVMMFKRTGIG